MHVEYVGQARAGWEPGECYDLSWFSVGRGPHVRFQFRAGPSGPQLSAVYLWEFHDQFRPHDPVECAASASQSNRG